MSHLLVVFRCGADTSLAVLYPEAEARKIVKDWREGTLPPIIGGTTVIPGKLPVEWAIRASEIKLCHTQEPEAIQAQAPQPVPYVQQGKQYRSGYQL